MMALPHFPTELLLLVASYLETVEDKLALAATCRRVRDATIYGLYRFFAVDRHANAAVWAALSGDTTVLDALWPYNPRLVNRYWEYDRDPANDFELRARNLRDWDQSSYPCPVCQLHACPHPPYPDNGSVDQALVEAVLGTVDLCRLTACFEYPRSGRFALLHLAALCNDTDQISWLLDHGASIDAPCVLLACREVDQDGDYPMLTALQLALCNRNSDSAKLLIERGASLGVGAGNRGRERKQQLGPGTPAVCVAAAFGLSDIVTFLVERGIQADQRDCWGYTALHHAADRCWQEEYFDIFKVLLDAGADLNDRDNIRRRSPLEIVYRQGNFAAVSRLLSLGASLDQLDTAGGRGATDLGLLHFTCAFEARGRALRSSLHSCFSNSRLDEDPAKDTFTRASWEASRQALVHKLLDLGYDPNGTASLDHPWCRDDTDGYIPPQGQIDQAWWETTAHSNILPRTGVTALNAVSFDCGVRLIELLVHRGVEVDARDSNNMPLLWQLCDSVEVMNDHYPDWYDSGFTYPGPTHEWKEKMELLLQAGARIDPWADNASGGLPPSERALQLSTIIDHQHFNFMMEKTTGRNMSDVSLGHLAGGLFAKGEYERVLSVLKNHGTVKLDAGKFEAEVWADVHINKYTAEAAVVPLLQYPLERRVADHLQRALRQMVERGGTNQ
jgi:ankyrin repeat protein